MSLEEFEDSVDPKTRRYLMTKSIMDIGMGVLYVGIGLIILFARKISLRIDFADSLVGKIFAGVVILYGLWRIYRGIKKDYLREL